jgi:hypothetical protein
MNKLPSQVAPIGWASQLGHLSLDLDGIRAGWNTKLIVVKKKLLISRVRLTGAHVAPTQFSGTLIASLALN